MFQLISYLKMSVVLMKCYKFEKEVAQDQSKY